MALTTRIGITKLEQAQLSAEVTLNEALDQIDLEVAVLDQANTYTGQQHFTGTPPASTTGALVRLGDRALTGMSAAGTLIGANMESSFTGDMIKMLVNDAQVFRVGAGGAIEGSRIAQSGGARGLTGMWALFVATVTPPTDADYTLTSSEYIAPQLVISTGAWTIGRNIIFPATLGGWVEVNNTTAFAVTFKTAAGTGITVAAARTATLYSNGVSIFRRTGDVDPTV